MRRGSWRSVLIGTPVPPDDRILKVREEIIREKEVKRIECK